MMIMTMSLLEFSQDVQQDGVLKQTCDDGVENANSRPGRVNKPPRLADVRVLYADATTPVKENYFSLAIETSSCNG